MEKQQDRASPLDMSPDEFRKVGYRMIDQIADFLASLPERPVNPGASLQQVRELLSKGSLPEGALKLGACSRTPPTFCLTILTERSSSLLGLHHLVCGAHRRVRRSFGGAVNPNVGA
jgi:hypothetical protein